jgi:hypothetical protein
MGLPDTMSMSLNNRRQIKDQYLLFEKLKTNAVAQSSTSSSVVGPRPTQKTVELHSPTTHSTGTVHLVPKQTLSSKVS